MNETRMASTAAERRTGAGDSCAGDRFPSRSHQSEGVKGPNLGKAGPHPLDTNPNRVPVTHANTRPRSVIMVLAFPAEWSQPKLALVHIEGQCHVAAESTFLWQRLLLQIGNWSCLGPFGTTPSGAGAWMVLAFSTSSWAQGIHKEGAKPLGTPKFVSQGVCAGIQGMASRAKLPEFRSPIWSVSSVFSSVKWADNLLQRWHSRAVAPSRNMWSTWHNFLILMLKKERRKKCDLKILFYLARYVHNIIVQACNQCYHITNEICFFFFWTTCSKSRDYFTCMSHLNLDWPHFKHSVARFG